MKLVAEHDADCKLAKMLVSHLASAPQNIFDFIRKDIPASQMLPLVFELRANTAYNASKGLGHKSSYHVPEVPKPDEKA